MQFSSLFSSQKIIYILGIINFFIVVTIISFISRSTVQTPQPTPTPQTQVNTDIQFDKDDFTSVTACLTEGQTTNCLDNFVAEIAGDQQIGQLLQSMELARANNSQIENNCHPIAHAIGRYAYQKFQNIGDAFEQCDFSCHSGCYHGVMERMFFTDEQIAANTQHLSYTELIDKIPGVCNEDKFKHPSTILIFQCLHGLGHALMYSLDYNLQDSLNGCDLLATAYEQTSCYGGVFMENVTAFEKAKRNIKRDDPHYPCNSLAAKFQSDCYMMQTSIMLELGLTHEQMAAECLELTGNLENVCFISIGRDLSNLVRLGEPHTVATKCESLDTNPAISCLEGAIYALIDNTHDGSFSNQLCSKVTDQVIKGICYLAQVEYMKYVYYFTLPQLEATCNATVVNDRELCKTQLTKLH